jgi:lipoprotein-anchoring transpeptidase ErfK/SrfK
MAKSTMPSRHQAAAVNSTNGLARMRVLAAFFLIIFSLGAHSAFAQDAVQPLTRADCDSVGMDWDETANVCAVTSGHLYGQPLTRLDCETAGMAWNDNANVCGSESQVAERDSPVAEGTNATASVLLVTIDKATQRMTVSLDGIERYVWPVSTGQPGYATPSGTYTARSMNEMWYSRQWDNAPMPHAVFFTREGHAIHGTNEVKRLGNPASHGCVRISPQNAATLYDLVSEAGLENTQIVLAGLTPGGEGRWASSAGSRSSYRVDSYDQPRRRGGLFRRLFGRR